MKGFNIQVEFGQFMLFCIRGHAFEIILSNQISQVVIFMFRFGGGYAVPAGHTRKYWDVTSILSCDLGCTVGITHRYAKIGALN